MLLIVARLLPAMFLLGSLLWTAVPAQAVRTCGGLPATQVGTPGNDVLNGTRGRDVIIGLRGEDRIRGLRGGDRLCGGLGRDVLVGGSGQDFLFGGGNRDRLVGGTGSDFYHGGPDGGVYSGDIADFRRAVNGIVGDLDQGGGAAAEGRASGQGQDLLYLMESAYLSPYDDTFGGSAAVNFLGGFGGDDILFGEGGYDVLAAGGGNDTIYGDEGDDVLFAGLGTDTADGGPENTSGDYCYDAETEIECEH